MEFILFRFFALLAVAFVASHGALTFEDYWRSVLPNTPMRKSISELLQSSGQIVRLPFGRNPFAYPAPTPSNAAATGQCRPSASVLANQPPPSPHQVIDKQESNKKRDAIDASKTNRNKNQKTITLEESPLDSVSSTFGSLAEDNFSERDVKLLKNRNDEEAEFSFKAGLGDAFYHGLMVLAQKNTIIKDQERSLKKLGGEAATFNAKMSEVQKKVAEELKASKYEVVKLQTAFDKLKLNAKKASEDLEGENSKLKGELEELKAGVRKGQSEAYTAGFLDYLHNFIAGDPDYDWSAHFAPSTPGYMLKFKIDNAEVIAAAKEELRRKVETELKVIAEEEARKKEAASGENTVVVSPSNTVVS